MVHSDNSVTLYIGKVELGQGTLTGLTQIAAEELDLDLGQITVAQVDTSRSPDQWSTARSSGIEDGGIEVRMAAAEARQALLQRAASRLNANAGDLTVSRGVVSVQGNTGRSVTYGELTRRSVVQSEVHGKSSPEAGQPIQTGGHQSAARRYSCKGGGPAHLFTV